MNEINARAGDSPSQHKSRVGEVATGVIAIVVGLVFLAGNFGIDFPFFGWHNWWALFILIGAAPPAARAFDRYRSVGRIDAQVAHAMVSALAVVTVALIFLLDASFGQWWPVFLVIGGLSMLVSGGKRKDCA
jgi:hypothetical protein